MEVPRHFEVSVTFTPIHDFAPQLMDGTRKYALFTPDQANSGQRNPYLEGTVIQPNATKANEAVNSIKTSPETPVIVANETNSENSGNAFSTPEFIDNKTSGL